MSDPLVPRPVQVTPDHYEFEKYDDAERWMSYWHQIRVVLRCRPKRVLEIGPGSGVFRNYLRSAGVEVSTLDIDASRGVDYVADITRLDATLPPGVTFDAICAFQVLEHLPYSDFETCLANIARRATPHVFISLPYRGLRIRWSFWWGDHHVSLGHKFMLPWKDKPIPEHHWELGKGMSARKITRVLAKHFDVVERGFIKENPYHYLWCLKVPGSAPRAALTDGT